MRTEGDLTTLPGLCHEDGGISYHIVQSCTVCVMRTEGDLTIVYCLCHEDGGRSYHITQTVS